MSGRGGSGVSIGGGRQAFDSWSLHPAAIDGAALALAFEAAEVPLGAWVVDPFAGSGRIGTFAVGRGEGYYGIEAHPLFASLARPKFSRKGQAFQLRFAAQEAFDRAQRPTLDLAGEHPLLQRLVPRKQLAELVALRDASGEDNVWADHLTLCVLRALRRTSGPGRGRARGPDNQLPRQSPGEMFIACANEMAADLERAPREPRAELILGDARAPEAWTMLAALGGAGACVSSPPYLNQLAYIEEARTDLFFLKQATSWTDLTALGSDLVASCTQQVKKRRALGARTLLERRVAVATSVEIVCRRLERARTARKRGKAYDWLVWAYLADIAAVLSELWNNLRPGAKSAWVVADSSFYGIHVDTPSLLSLIAADIGFEVLTNRWLRQRGRRWAGAAGVDGIPLSERLLVFRKPPIDSQPELPGFDIT